MTKVAQIVSDGLTRCGDLFSSPRPKLDAQNHDPKALNCLPVFVGDLPGDHSRGAKAQGYAIHSLSRAECNESTVLDFIRQDFYKSVTPDRNPKAARWKICKHKCTVRPGAHDALSAGSFRGVGIGREERDFRLGDGFAGVGAGNAPGNLSQRRLGGLGRICCLGGWKNDGSQQE